MENMENYINEAGFVSYITKDIREKERITSLCDDILVTNGFEKKWDDILCIWEYHMTASQYGNNKKQCHLINICIHNLSEQQLFSRQMIMPWYNTVISYHPIIYNESQPRCRPET